MDFDGGWLAGYLVNGSDLYDRGVAVRNGLYGNNGDGAFTDFTDKAGVAGTGWGCRVCGAWGGAPSDLQRFEMKSRFLRLR